MEHPEILAPISLSDHNLIIWKSKIQIPRKNIIRKINVRPLKHSALQQFNEFLNQYNWSSVVTADSTDAKVEEFLKVTQGMIDNFFPGKTIKLHHDDKFFITAKIKGLMRKRDKAYKQGMTAPFKSLRNQIAAEIHNEKAKFYNEKIRPTYDRKPATWWNKINQLIGKKKKSPFILNDLLTECPMNDKDTANCINNFFAGLTKDYPEVQNKWSECGELDILPTITQESVKRKLSNLQTNKAPGPNKILILSQDP